MDVTINWLAILVAVLIGMVLGALWYGPLFGKTWAKLWGFAKDGPKDGFAKAMVFDGIFLFAMAYVLRHVIVLSQNFYDNSALQIGLSTGFFMWLGFALPVLGVIYMFARKPTKLLVLDSAYQLVVLLAIGALLATWV